jgi:hypothetical protein
MHYGEHTYLAQLIDTQVFGSRKDWEKHEIGGTCSFVKPIEAKDPELKARIAARFDELGFIPMFFREHGRDYIAIEGMKQSRHYKTVEQAFAAQILTKAT